MKTAGIARRIDDLGRVVIPKEIRRTMRIREGDPLLTTLTGFDRFCAAVERTAITKDYRDGAPYGAPRHADDSAVILR